MYAFRATFPTSHQVDRHTTALCKLFPQRSHCRVFLDLSHSVVLHHRGNSAPVRPVTVRCCELLAIRLNRCGSVFLVLLHFDDAVTDTNLATSAVPQIPRLPWISETAPSLVGLHIFSLVHPRHRPRDSPVPQRPSARPRRSLLNLLR